MKFFNHLSLQLLLLAILPISVFGLAIGYYSYDLRQQQIQHFTGERSKQLSKQFAIVQNHSDGLSQQTLLQALASSSVEQQGLHAIAIIDNNERLLAHAGPVLPKEQINDALTKNLQRFKDGNFLHFIIPLPKQTISANLSLHPEPLTRRNDIWLLASYDLRFYKQQFYFQEMRMAAIFFGIFISAGLLAWFISRRMQSDFNRLSDYAKRFAKTKRVERLAIHSSTQVRKMVHSIEQAAAMLSQELDNMRHSVELTTSDLKETIETIEIQNIELNIAKKSATKASEIKSQFLANTSHEIRTPLNGIIGFTQLLQSTPLNAEQQDYLQTIQQSSDGLLAIINDILDFSKIEAGKLTLENQPFTLQKVLDESMALFAPSAYEKGLDIALMVYQDVPQHLLGDALRIKQIIHNLLSNAIKFTDHGHVEIRASLEAENEQSCQISFEISDTGIGLNQEQQRSLFESFFQANNAMTRQYGGTGLGLSISRNLIALMHGNIGVDSDIGQGTSFYFTLKLDKDPAPPVSIKPPALLAQQTILVCEPHTLSALGVKHLLLQLGAKDVSIVSDITELLAQNLDHFDALFISSNNQHDNTQNIQQLEEISKHFHQRIFSLVPLCQRTKSMKQKLSRISYCSKPLSLEKLTACIENKDNSDIVNTKQPVKKLALNAPWNILICDDHPANLKLLNILLSDLGLNVSQAEHGQQAINLAQSTHFDLIFMDIQMPTISGIDVCNTLRENEGPNQQTPIVALTANALSKEKKLALEQGFNRYLTKPIDTSQIQQCIVDFCEPEASQKPAAIDSNILNIPQSLKLANNNADIAYEMLNGLISELHDFIDALPTLNQEQLSQQLHKIHGACSYTGTKALQEACKHYEMALHDKQDTVSQKQGFLDAAKALLEALTGMDLKTLFLTK